VYSYSYCALILCTHTVYSYCVLIPGATPLHYLGANQFDSPSDSALAVRPTQGMAVLFPTAYLPDAPADVPASSTHHGVLPGNKIWSMHHQVRRCADSVCYYCGEWAPSAASVDKTAC
jgi:hypothetical protein